MPPALALDEKFVKFKEELTNHSVPTSEFRLRQIMAECRRVLPSAGTEVAANLYLIMGLVHSRSGSPREAYECYRKASLLQPSESAFHLNMGVSLCDQGRPLEALDEWAIAAELSSERRALLYANSAEALFKLGLREDALEVFGEAVNATDFTDANEVFVLAMQAAEIGADAEALELTARFLSVASGSPLGDADPLDFVLSAPETLMKGVRNRPRLSAVIDRGTLARSLRASVRTAAESVDTTTASEDDALAVFHATESMRNRATDAVLNEA